MSYQGKLEIGNYHFRQYSHEVNVSPQPCKEVDEFEKYLETLEQEVQDLESSGNLTYDKSFYITTIGVGSNVVVAFAEVKQEDNSPEEPKLGPELQLFPSHSVLVGCTSCYMYMMLPSNKPVCFKCHKRAQTVGELENK